MTKSEGKQKSRLKIAHAQNDARYVERGKGLHLVSDPNWISEILSMNHKKHGRPFKYAETLFMLIAAIKHQTKTSLRSCQGMVTKALGPENAPDHTTIQRRVNALNVEDDKGLLTVRGSDHVVCLIPDGTGLSPSNRGEWIRKVHKVKHGFIRFSIMINQQTLEILAFRITDEHTGDSPQFKGLLDDSMKKLNGGGTKSGAPETAAGSDGQTGAPETAAGSDGQTGVPETAAGSDGQERKIIVKADGGYDTREIFSHCEQLGVDARIRIRVNANTRAHGVDRARANAAMEQLGGDARSPKEFARMDDETREMNRKEWKARVGFGGRWNVEIVFAALENMRNPSILPVRP